MMFSVKCIKIAILLCYVHGIVSYPKYKTNYGDVDKDASRGVRNKQISEKDAVVRSVRLNDRNIKSHLVLNDNMYEQNGHGPGRSGDSDTATGNIKVDDDGNMEGALDIPHDGDNGQPNGVNDQNSNVGNNGQSGGGDADTVSGNIKIDNDGNVEGTIDIPDDGKNSQSGGSNGNNGQSGGGDADTVSGNIKIDNDGNVEGTIDIPDGGKNSQPGGSNGNNGQYGGGDADTISGNIKIDNDGNVEGTIDIPDDGKNGQSRGSNGNNGQYGGGGGGGGGDADTISGNIKIDDDGNLEGTIEIPDDGKNGQPGGSNGNNGQDGGGNADTISGNIQIDNDGNVEGTIDIPDDGKNGQPRGSNGNNGQYGGGGGGGGGDADTISGNIKIDDDGNLEGTIEIPDDGKNGQPGGSNGNNGQNGGGNADTISGNIQIDNDGNVEGTIDIPDDGKNGQPRGSNGNNGQYGGGGGGDADTISGNIKIDDDGNMEGTIEIPDDGKNGQPGGSNGKNGQYGGGDADTVSGNIKIDNDGNVEGTIEIPDDGKNGQPGGSNGNNGQNGGGNADTISGNIQIDNDGNVEGTIDIPDDGKTGQHDNKGADNDGITGEIKIDEEGNMEGVIHVNHDNNKNNNGRPTNKKDCWMNLKSKQYLDALDQIDAKYSNARSQYQSEIGPEFDRKMMEVLLSSQGKAPRAIHQAHGNPNIIPAGLNLGGFCMMRMPGSMLFFHRMKLRNSTVFHVEFLKANLMDMTLVARLSLNDLHLRGAYERATTEGDMNVMYINPNYGELDVLIKSVLYKMEGRLRMLNHRLMIELVNSEIEAEQILISYANTTEVARNIAYDSIDDFVIRMKRDLDLWLKDYFNDYLMYFGIVGCGKNSEIQLYEKQKTIKANEYADHAIKGIKQKLRDLKAANVKVPDFTLASVLNHKISLTNGVLRGLDSIHRRSVAMTKKNNTVRTLDMIIGFSNLKVEYTYEATVLPGMPLMTGMMIFTADELTAHLEVSQVDGSQTFDMNVDSIKQLKPESLTVEGPANRLIADYKFLIENPILAIMSNVMRHNVKMLKTLARCEPHLWGESKDNYSNSNDNKRLNDIAESPDELTKESNDNKHLNDIENPDELTKEIEEDKDEVKENNNEK